MSTNIERNAFILTFLILKIISKIIQGAIAAINVLFNFENFDVQ